MKMVLVSKKILIKSLISKNDVQSIELMSKDELSDLIFKIIKIKESHSC